MAESRLLPEHARHVDSFREAERTAFQAAKAARRRRINGTVVLVRELLSASGLVECLMPDFMPPKGKRAISVNLKPNIAEDVATAQGVAKLLRESGIVIAAFRRRCGEDDQGYPMYSSQTSILAAVLDQSEAIQYPDAVQVLLNPFDKT